MKAQRASRRGGSLRMRWGSLLEARSGARLSRQSHGRLRGPELLEDRRLLSLFGGAPGDAPQFTPYFYDVRRAAGGDFDGDGYFSRLTLETAVFADAPGDVYVEAWFEGEVS